MRDSTERLLRAAGWHPGRSLETASVRSFLESEGYHVSDQAEQFLREFTGVSIDFTRNRRTDTIWFDGKRAGSLADLDWVTYYEEQVKTSLTPIGYSNHEHLLLMAAADGSFYGGYDDFLWPLGEPATEMIEKLLNQAVEPPA
jgi:SUKH-3 immunity protein